MPDGDTNETLIEPGQNNDTGSNLVSTSNTTNVLEKLTTNIDNIIKDNKKASSLIAHNYTNITNIKNDVKSLSSTVDTYKITTHQEIVKIIQDINELKADSFKEGKSDIDIKKEANNEEVSKDNKNNDEQIEENKNFMSKVARMVISMLPSKLFKNNQKEHKTTSKLDEKIYNVKITSFSSTANNQLINNLKQVLKIEKKRESFVTKSNMLKLAILAFTGMLIYLLSQIKEVREAFSNWIVGIKDDISSIKDTIIVFFQEQINNLSKLFTQPLSKTIDSLVECCKSLFNKVSEPVKNIFNSFDDLKTGLVTAWKSIKEMSSADIMKLFTLAFTKLKLAINNFLGWDAFKIEKEQPQGEVTDETNPTPTDNTGSISVGSQQPKQGNDNVDNNSQQSLIKVDGNTITNTNTAVNNQQNTFKDGNTTLNGSVLKLQNGTIFNLHKNDDIYIANKPGGVIHGIFQEINSNYSNVKNIFIDSFNSIIANIENQDKSFNQLIDKLNIHNNSQLSTNTNAHIINLQNQIDILNQKTQDSPITYTGVSTMRDNFRARFI